ncbi:hypothetical protein KUD11_11285 [Roseovarius sp. LXJ103]|uniref:hypothetical protein n=1 Tax=Roseovarius carneus TaxID=2853164 RepID=UPI000D617709|nr:hypothetical protein [Roseovarius carneus]MBZ8119226.1 hypothetical protein [Roseovarius carneus]PWE35148.1 hypothetical protein DD563_03695 [Pelagicola sp. LXJ1103]
MYGVVIWSDQVKNRAVIWCEDHGDLAYFRGETTGLEVAEIGPGDLVEFDLAASDGLRLADAPRLVSEKSHLHITRALSRTTPAVPAPRKRRSEMSSGWDAEIVRFDRARCAGAA